MSTKLLYKVYRWLINGQYWLFPGICLICKRASDRQRDICNSCEQRLPIIRKPCLRCALPLVPVNLAENICGNCLIKPPRFRYCISPFSYSPPLDKLISDFKFHDKLLNGNFLAEQLLVSVKNFYLQRALPELIMPVPLHPKRLRSRGYNQALELAKKLSKALSIPLDYRNCYRSIDTLAQMSLPASQRARNLRNAFLIRNPDDFKHRSIAIIDDVITTMSTVHEVSRILLKHGVKEVHVWAVARTCK